MSIAWVFIVIAGLVEIIWSISLKMMGFDSAKGLMWVGINLATLAVLTFCMNRATQVIPIGTAYAMFTGIGTIGSVAVGIWLFKESTAWPRMLFLSLLLVSILGLKATTKESDLVTKEAKQ
jgi:multidrug transporter EmrE-like cation transporter